MRSLSIECSFCNWTGTLNIYQKHLDLDHSNPICSHCNQQFTSVNDLNRHVVYDCKNITIDCPFEQFGFDEKILRINLSKHYLSEQHQKVLIYIARHIKTILSNVTNKCSTISSQLTIDHHQNEDDMARELKETNETMSTLSAGVDVLNDDLKRVNMESIQHKNALDSLSPDISTLKLSIQEQNKILDDINNGQEVTEKDIQSMKEKLNDMKGTSYDGTFLWKITDVKEKMDGRQISIYSPAFYSSPNGYKMCVRLYLNGDGNAHGTHVSIFFVLMRGEYDAILKFPFHFKVMFCLYAQNNQQNHIIDSFTPDTKSNSFQRPRSDMNIASGIPKFVLLTTLQNDENSYIHNNTMFIKTVVDFVDMPKRPLTYAFGLNQGLTNSIQQTRVQQENERQT
ncbi:unnamed protein product [Rotaria sp. Silwood1]|nr:unnamed protein product [Rotaria sp. Silwood1]CAF4950129.1 unnamed protein product [Rotaria sp. Silwood1]CAF4979125.1 unnamed protein product [Rotaria sp. Silwood1]